MEPRLATLLVHGESPRVGGAVVHPIFQSANYLQTNASTYGEVVYQRLSNTPQHDALSRKLALLEGADLALPFSSGMAAVSTALLSQLSSGDHILVQRNVYGGTATLLSHDLARFGITSTEIDPTDSSGWAAAIGERTRAIYVEGISNPLLEVPDLSAVIRVASEHRLLSIIDNTFLSPAGFRPIPFGFDLVVHSATKYMNGHSDIVAGVVAGKRAAMERVVAAAHHLGGSLDPHACFLLDRGLKTLSLRIARQTESALSLALFLADHPKIARVRYPGLPGDPSHRRAREHYDHFGAMIAVEARTEEIARDLVARLKIVLHAASLGGVESLAVLPSQSSHLGLSPEERARIGISDRLVRISVGIEDGDDLLEDLSQALA